MNKLHQNHKTQRYTFTKQFKYFKDGFYKVINIKLNSNNKIIKIF